ncbi:CAP domain-containing protein [Sulfurovum sp. bin170]|uniref:CAP domain-containing protein n=1 Tax=Sulfurovum sp. bin170 TaxID=2695268 RepID=UPI0013DFC5E4|nr:CAP domain-containing protein [Sulfurovum sp. bin170]NEW61750.1 CAP domain-containing protein [Sulfurovum sp. bin170]
MKNIIRISVWGLVALSAGYVYLLAGTTPLGQNIIIKEEPLLDIDMEQRRTLHYLNRLRVGAGLIPLVSNQKLESAAKNHASYLIKNGLIGHYEDKKRVGFTGVYGSQRSMSAGYETSMVIENISNNNFTYKESVDGLMAAIYHRFGFLDFHIDEIGIGVLQSKTDRSQTAFVYDMGSRKLVDLCKKKREVKQGRYMENICIDKKQKIKLTLFNETLQKNRYRNSKIITYPFSGQEDIPPAFYDELPDPLPEYSVSGFPISISFNESYFKTIKMISFELFDEESNEIEDTIIYSQESDPNRKLKKFEYALFPLKRLAWSSNYRVKAVYEADGKLKREIWQFKTRDFKTPIRSVTADSHSFNINRGEDNIFYFPPKSKNDTLGSLKYPASLDISFIDKNTIKLIALTTSNKRLVLEIGDQQLHLDIKN